MYQKGSDNRKRIIITLICTTLAGLLFVVRNDVFVPEEGEAISGFAELLAFKCRMGFRQASMTECLLVLLLGAAFWYLYPKVQKKNLRWMIPAGAVYSLILLLCDSYYRYASWRTVFGDKTAFLLSLLKIAGMTVCLVFLFSFIETLSLPLRKDPAENAGAKGSDERRTFYRAVVRRMLLFLLLWLPYMIILLPGGMNPDTTAW